MLVGIYIGSDRFNSRTIHLHLKDQAPPVRIGAAVKVVMVAGHAQVEVPGIARTSGRLGDPIEVEIRIGTPTVTTFHTGILVGPGIVQVKL